MVPFPFRKSEVEVMYPEPAKMAEKPSLKAKGGTASVGAKREEARTMRYEKLSEYLDN